MQRPWATCALMASIAQSAWAAPSVIANETVSFVSGPRSPSAEAPSLTGPISVGGMWNPRLRAGVSAQIWVPIGKHWTFAGSYGVFRDQHLCDTCGDGDGPGWLGDELLGSTDLSLSMMRVVPLGEKTQLQLVGIAVLPASKDALVCNPMFGAPGLAVGIAQPIRMSVLSASVRAVRPIYQFAAAPVGRCAPPLVGDATVGTLAGGTEPLPWQSTRFVGANPTFTTAASMFWRNPHAVLKNTPKWLTTGLSLGITAQRNAHEGRTEVSTLTGAVDLAPARRPYTGAVPWALAVGVRPSTQLELQLTLSNQVPTWLADPGGTFLSLPSQTTVAFQARQRLGKPSTLPPSQR